jgi:TM2 domain-containing membrane protein YozV
MVEWILQPTKKVSKGMGILILILNIIPGGIGTIIYGRVLRGVLEFLLGILVIPWIFSIIDGVQVMTKGTSA